MENGPIQDVFPIENGDIPACYVSLPEGAKYSKKHGEKMLSFPHSPPGKGGKGKK